MSNKVLLFHGGTDIIKSPTIIKDGKTKDFGYGFYLTKYPEQAEHWSIGKFKERSKYECNTVPIVNVYSLDIDELEKMNFKVFEETNGEWLDFILDCRNRAPHKYDAVSGPMADNIIHEELNDYLTESITREEFFSICKLGFDTHQIMLTGDALKLLDYVCWYYTFEQKWNELMSYYINKI